MAAIEITINSTINVSIQKALFEVLYGKNIPLPVDLLLSRDSAINPQEHKFARKIKQLNYQVKRIMHDD